MAINLNPAARCRAMINGEDYTYYTLVLKTPYGKCRAEKFANWSQSLLVTGFYRFAASSSLYRNDRVYRNDRNYEMCNMLTQFTNPRRPV